MSGWTNKGLASVMDGTVDLNTHTIKVMLLNSSYVFNPDHDFVDDISANEISVSGYIGGFGGGGRKTITNPSVTADNANNLAVFDGDDLTWSSLAAGATIAYAAIIREITNDAASIYIACVPVTQTNTNGNDFTITWAAGGILNATSA